MLTKLECIKNAILSSLKELDIDALQTLLIGSLARGNSRKCSDADIMICFKRNKVPKEDTLYELIDKLESKIGRKVDLIVFEYMNKFIRHEQRDIDFIENAMTDAIQIDNNSKVGKEFIELSNKIGLYKYIN